MNGDQQATLGVEDSPLLVLLDGHAMVHRAFHAIQNPLTLRRTGEEVRGAYGFTQMMLRAVETLRPTHLILTFDYPTPTFRHDLFEDYKAQRPSMPQELSNQFPHIRRLMEALRVPIMEMDRYEADDLLGTLSSQAANRASTPSSSPATPTRSSSSARACACCCNTPHRSRLYTVKQRCGSATEV